MPSPKDLDLTPIEAQSHEVLTPNTIAGLKISSPDEFDWINMLVYGEPGVGKTRLAGSSILVPDMCPVLLMDFEGGTLSLAGDMRDVDVVRLKTWERVDRLYGALYDKNPYKTVVI